MASEKTMKQIFIAALIAIYGITPSTAQVAKKPTLAVMPRTDWCTQNGFAQTLDGFQECDLNRCFAESSELNLVAGKIGGFMADRGFPLKSLAQKSKGDSKQEALRAARRSKSSSSALRQNSVDLILRNTSPDIVINVWWQVEKSGPNKKITIQIEAIDAYTYKQVAEASATGNGSYSASINELLQEAVIANFDNFCARLDAHFKDLLENGREIAFGIGVWESAAYDLEKEFNGKELKRILKDWLAQNTIKGRYSVTTSSENFMEMEQVRIDPTIDSEEFGFRLQDFLKQPPYSIESKVSMVGLGYTEVIIGEK